MTVGDSSWVDSEFSSISLGDKRLNRRAISIGKSLSSNPSGSIPSSCIGWSETHAAYSFFSNPKVSSEKILAPHIESSLERASRHRVVLAVQDTTSLSFTGHKATSGLGEVGNSRYQNAKGLINHNTYLLSDSGVPLGLIDQDIWDRKTSKVKNSVIRTKTPIHKKESIKWLKALNKTSEMTSRLENTKVIHVADREADIYSLFDELECLDEKFIIRARCNRRINKSSRGSFDGEKLFDRLEQEKSLGTIEVEVNEKSSPSRKRTACLELKALSFSLTAPRAKSMKSHRFKSERLPLTVVSAVEVKSDGELAGINWILLTNTDIQTKEQVHYCVECYSKRWTIEVFHRILKTGCRVESVRFNCARKIKAYAAFLAVVAWHLHWLTLHTRETPKEKADKIFSKEDQEILRKILLKKTRGKKKQFTIKDCVILLARLGGFLARKSDGLPGAEVLWRGLTKLHYIKHGLNCMEHNV